MNTPTREDILRAAERISGWVRCTPVLPLPDGIGGGFDLDLKLDLLQPTGSFKVRGAFSALLARDEKPERVVAASGGNFGLAVAYAAQRLGIDAEVFVPETSPPAKASRLEQYGAKTHRVGEVYSDALEASRQFAAETGAFLAHAYDQLDVVAGQGTCGLEMQQQLPDDDTVLVAVGGGGLIGGISSWYRGDAVVVGIETEGTPTLFEARRAGMPVDVAVSGDAASSLGATRLGEIAWEAAQSWVDDAIVVSDTAVAEAQRWLWDECRLVAEPGAAAPMAALLSGAYRPAPKERVAVLVCGANTDPGSVA